MALAQKQLAARFNKPGSTMFDYRIYGLCSDGDMMKARLGGGS